ncbi:MAG: hypothetical protein K6U14_12135 [Firmicutes bacterium]|nr:hypothetical protein [Alicyclobacillaceae bacterium]MCL6498361.1 hypothetical protein [Bacillota bacterium]
MELDEVAGKLALAGTMLPNQSPLYHAQNADRYERPALIRQYEVEYQCRLMVIVDVNGP